MDIYELYEEIKNSSDNDKNDIIDKYEITLNIFNFIKSKDVKWFEKFYKYAENKNIDDFKQNIIKQKLLKKEIIDFLLTYNEEKINDIDTEDEYDDDIYISDPVVYDSNFKFRENQSIGLQKSEEQNFRSGIHNQIMGAGKSYMILNTIYRHYLKETNKNKLLYVISCSHIEILENMFYKNKKIDIEKKEMWRCNNIINLDLFNIYDCLLTKPTKKEFIKYTLNINKATILIVNNEFYNNRMYNDFCPKLFILDECQSITAKKLYDNLHYLKYKNKCSIIGFSATPLRTNTISKSIHNLIEIFSKTFREDKKNKAINIISTYSFMDAIVDDVVLPFHIKYVKFHKTSNKGTNNMQQINEQIVKTVLDDVVELLPYKKILSWCKSIANMKIWNKFYKNNYPNFKNYYSSCKDNDNDTKKDPHCHDIEKYFNDNGNAIMCCVNKYREGSDIYHLDCASFLDSVKKRSLSVFMQCGGRVIRPDKEKLKTHGYIIDVYCEDDNKESQVITIEHIIEYYKIIASLSLDPKNEQEYNTISKLINNTVINNTTKIIEIKLDDKKNHNIIIDLKYSDKTCDWSNIKTILKRRADDIYKKTLEDKFNIIIKKLNNMDVFDINCDHWEIYNNIKNKEKKGLPDNIYEEFKEIFDKKTWYDILEYDVSNFYSVKKVIKHVKTKFEKIKMTNKKYIKLVRDNKLLPLYPDEYYRLDNDYISIKETFSVNNDNFSKLF